MSARIFLIMGVCLFILTTLIVFLLPFSVEHKMQQHDLILISLCGCAGYGIVSLYFMVYRDTKRDR